MPGSNPAENLLSNLIVWPEVLVTSVPGVPVRVATVEFVTAEIVAVWAVFPERNTTSPASNSVLKLLPSPVSVDVASEPELAVVPVIPWCVANCKLNGVNVKSPDASYVLLARVFYKSE